MAYKYYWSYLVFISIARVNSFIFHHIFFFSFSSLMQYCWLFSWLWMCSRHILYAVPFRIGYWIKYVRFLHRTLYTVHEEMWGARNSTDRSNINNGTINNWYEWNVQWLALYNDRMVVGSDRLALPIFVWPNGQNVELKYKYQPTACIRIYCD